MADPNFDTWSGLANQGANYTYDPNNPGAWGDLQNQMGNYYGSTGADVAPSSGGFLGLTGSQWAGGLKDLAGGLKGAAVTPQGSAAQRPVNPNTSQAQAAHGQAGGLGPLLQLLAQRANLYWQAAHQGAVPTPTRPGGGLLGL